MQRRQNRLDGSLIVCRFWLQVKNLAILYVLIVLLLLIGGIPIGCNYFLELQKVWGSSASDVFAVGGSDILHYDGTGWSEMRRD